MEYDLHHKIKSVSALNLKAIAGNGTSTGNIIDTKGIGSIDFVGFAKTVTDGEYTLKLEEGDDSGLSDAAVVPSANLHGSLFQFDEYKSNLTLRTGCASKKRYIRASLVATNVSTGVDMIGVTAILGHLNDFPDEQV